MKVGTTGETSCTQLLDVHHEHLRSTAIRKSVLKAAVNMAAWISLAFSLWIEFMLLLNVSQPLKLVSDHNYIRLIS